MTVEERKDKLNKLGAVIARELPDFYGNVQFNIQGGKFVNGNANDGFKPESKPERQE
jgi:hypothetical protein